MISSPTFGPSRTYPASTPATPASISSSSAKTPRISTPASSTWPLPASPQSIKIITEKGSTPHREVRLRVCAEARPQTHPRHPQSQHHEAHRRVIPRLRTQNRTVVFRHRVQRAHRRQHLHAACAEPLPIRRHPHREPLRRHPFRPLLGLRRRASALCPEPISASIAPSSRLSTAPRQTSPAKTSPIPPRCCRAPSSCSTTSTNPPPRPACRPPSNTFTPKARPLPATSVEAAEPVLSRKPFWPLSNGIQSQEVFMKFVSAPALLCLLSLSGCKPDAAIRKGEVLGDGAKNSGQPTETTSRTSVTGPHTAPSPVPSPTTAQPQLLLSTPPWIPPAPWAAARTGSRLSRSPVSHGKLANVFVYVKSGPAQAMNAAPASTQPVIMDQQHCRYVPHVVGVLAGGTVEFRNSDPTMHNIHTPPASTTRPSTSLKAPAARLSASSSPTPRSCCPSAATTIPG